MIRSGLYDARQLDRSRAFDEVIRTTMMANMRLGWPAGEALGSLLISTARMGVCVESEAEQVSRDVPELFAGAEGEGKDRSVALAIVMCAVLPHQLRHSRGRAAGITQCVSMSKSGKQLRTLWNRGKCRDPCSKRTFA